MNIFSYQSWGGNNMMFWFYCGCAMHNLFSVVLKYQPDSNISAHATTDRRYLHRHSPRPAYLVSGKANVNRQQFPKHRVCT